MGGKGGTSVEEKEFKSKMVQHRRKKRDKRCCRMKRRSEALDMFICFLVFLGMVAIYIVHA